jgi:phosphoribosylaminoimidazolecarboxamide formyltransferase/IMP cyclohydrolase
MVERALISVYDKSGLDELVKALGKLDIEIVSSGGTAKRIRELGYDKVTEVADYTGHPESRGGLLKTLHPKIHGGLLLNPEDPEHGPYMEKHGIEAFDMVVVNLYPFEEAVARGASLKEAAENIDIGGPTMIRAAAKAALLYDQVAVVIDPNQYHEIIETLRATKGELTTEIRKGLAKKAFKRTAEYETAISAYLNERER